MNAMQTNPPDTRFFQSVVAFAIVAVTGISIVSTTPSTRGVSAVPTAQAQSSPMQEALVAKLSKAPFNIPSGEISSLDVESLKTLQRQHYASIALNYRAADCQAAQVKVSMACSSQ